MKLLDGTELDATSYPEFRDRIVRVEADPVVHAPRTYPGYPRTTLPPMRARPLMALDRVLLARRSRRELGTQLPSPARLARLLGFAHGVSGVDGRGPVPSSGLLHALELFVAVIDGGGWLDRGTYHYDRGGHHLSRLGAGLDRSGWRSIIPSMEQFTGGALLWLLAGDRHRIESKYGACGQRFLLLEAGHLMQNLCLLSTSLGLCTLPLGGSFDRAIARAVPLPRTDAVLYVGACG